MCLTCGCNDAHKRMGNNLTYEDLRDMAAENGQTVDEALRMISSTAATDRQLHTEEYAEPWAGEAAKSTTQPTNSATSKASAISHLTNRPDPDPMMGVSLTSDAESPLPLGLEDEGLGNLEIGETTGLGPADEGMGNVRKERGPTER